MSPLSPSRLLRAALTIDAAASATLAMVQVLAPHAVAHATGLAVELLVITGLLLAAYAAQLIWIASGTTVGRPLLDLAIVGNAGWALGCIAVATAAFDTLTSFGVGYLWFQAAAFIGFAGAQMLGAMRSGPLPRTTAHLELKDIL